MDANARQFGKKRFELLPDPFGNDFAGWVFQARDVIQIIVVELFVERFEDRLDLGEVTNPAGMGVNVAFDINRYTEGVPVQASAFMAFRDVGEVVSGLEHKLFEQFHAISLRQCGIAPCNRRGA